MTVNTASAHGFAVGDQVRIAGPPSTIQGEFVVASVPSGTSLTFVQAGSNETSIDIDGPNNNQTTWAVGRLTYYCTPGVLLTPTATLFSYDQSSTAAPFWVELTGYTDVSIDDDDATLADVSHDSAKLVVCARNIRQETISAFANEVCSFGVQNFVNENSSVTIRFQHWRTERRAFLLRNTSGVIEGRSLISDQISIELNLYSPSTALLIRLPIIQSTLGTAIQYIPLSQSVGGQIVIRADKVSGEALAIAIAVDTVGGTRIWLLANDIESSSGPAVEIINGHSAVLRSARIRSLSSATDAVALDIPSRDAANDVATLHKSVLVSSINSSVSIQGPPTSHESCRIYGMVMANKPKGGTIDLIANPSGFVNDANVV